MSGTYGLEPKAKLSDHDQCVDAKALVPGDPEQMRIVASRFRRVGNGANRVVDLLHRVDAGEWVGESGDLFRSVMRDAHVPFDTTATVMRSVAASLDDLADTIDAARKVAVHSGLLIGEAQAASEQWTSASAGGADPGDVIRRQAHRNLSVAQDVVDSTAQRTVRVLKEGRAHAPDGHEWRALADGFTNAISQSAELAASLSPHRFVTDRDQARHNYAAFGDSLVAPVLHPRDAAKAVWQQFEDDPNAFFGSLLPAMLLGGPSGEARALLLAKLSRRWVDLPEVVVPDSDGVSTPPLTAEVPPASPAAADLPPAPLHDVVAPPAPLGPLPRGPLTPEQAQWLDGESTRIVDGHAWKKHYEVGELPWIHSRDELKAYVESVIREPSDFHQALRDRMFFWDDQHQVLVSVDENNDGTVFVPTSGKSRFEFWVEKDLEQRKSMNGG